ncbi:alpha/beta hydrolase family protein [Bradyrhizobium sp.]|uniref:alpha/beta hydrolase family protein n=1 Tax=Bradyrhizobium sp. TaxID=376 RepID=UPI001D54E3AF|nr:CocE/NonD family hydrolase [Bradyrhizobium sp.]MBV8701516.1 dienelactone hydrolase [Bradyrhizobium sp.]MBV8917754.1 dienelactone hydrolase [Bradyrhizobium sp.]MBV9980143.1 dienelactone hydrolase [Bradyrhizobium sp.]
MIRINYAYVVAAGLVLQALLPASLRAEGIRTDELQIPAVISGATFKLEAIVVRPDDGGPHPLALINHGSPRDGNDRAKMSPYRMWSQAAAFARRGWTAVVLLRRGYGRSEGGWAEAWGGCAHPDYARAGRIAAGDIAAAARFMTNQPYVSKNIWISVGVSAGGFATVALTAAPPPGLAAAIAFAPGRGSSAPDQVCGEPELVAAFAAYGKTSRTPLLWVSAPNDHFFGPRLVKEMTDAFSSGGSHLSFVAAPAFGEDGHQLFRADGMAIWSPIVDRFLTDNHLKLREREIAVDVPDLPAPTGLSDKGREAFRTYLASGPNKAFVVSGTHFGWSAGRRSADDAVKEALGICAPGTGLTCTVVNINDKPAK